MGMAKLVAGEWKENFAESNVESRVVLQWLYIQIGKLLQLLIFRGNSLLGKVVHKSKKIQRTKSVNVTDQYGWTALMSAACAGAVEVVKFLISCGADVSLRDKSGNTCLSLARRNGHHEVVQAITEGHRQTEAESQPSQTRHVEFYCESCKQNFHSTSREQHATSTVHLFSSRPQVAVPTMYGIPTSNKGYQILLKRGWDREKGLGPDGSGHKFPLKTVLKCDRKGFGADTKEKARVTHFKPHAFPVEQKTNTGSRRKREALRNKERRKEQALRRELGDML
ncbi:G patch domain and ankyrin repeat-containing protein 1 homolog isoform X2 [Cryptotermes secundus]|uniref:G patch domain and ankyrin repeat-containing protein 1 homolog isoform X2 n=1 Tax=Cryptotermes secundus TaxID=105785 RepID=UPI000CD7BABB|nr:G patch domain and ankyrin repeat-containing protein 1 homolog isoform X2 [Cryptotermes secundus]